MKDGPFFSFPISYRHDDGPETVYGNGHDNDDDEVVDNDSNDDDMEVSMMMGMVP